MYRSKPKKGISTILGAIFTVAVLMVGLNAMIYVTNVQNSLSQVVTQKGLTQTQQSTEKIVLRDGKISNSKFNMTVANTGSIPVHLVRIWVTNQSDPNGWHQQYNIDKLVNPGTSLTNLGQDLSLFARNSSSYTINLVSERGNSAYFQILAPKDKAIKMSLFAVPRSIPTGQNVTILFAVTNNLTDGSIIQSIKPVLSPPTVIANGTSPTSATLMEGPTPVIENSLTLGQTVFLKWVYKITGDPGAKMIFNATIANAKAGNYVMDRVQVADVATIATATSAATSTASSIARSAYTSLMTTTSGRLAMNFTSFQFCEPSAVSCTSNSANWKAGWQVQAGHSYIWRVNITNYGSNDIFLDANTAILLLHVQTTGGGNAPTALFIKANSTTTLSDGGAYVPYSGILRADGKYRTVYFGAAGVGGSTLQSISTSVGLYAVNIVMFGYQDANNNHIYESAIDTTPYSQNIPFQGLRSM